MREREECYQVDEQGTTSLNIQCTFTTSWIPLQWDAEIRRVSLPQIFSISRFDDTCELRSVSLLVVFYFLFFINTKFYSIF